jgi:hypothetical protein
MVSHEGSFKPEGRAALGTELIGGWIFDSTCPDVLGVLKTCASSMKMVAHNLFTLMSTLTWISVFINWGLRYFICICVIHNEELSDL